MPATRSPAHAAISLATMLIASWLLPNTSCKRAVPTPHAHEDKLVVFAAASLREAFTTIGDRFKAAHPGVDVTFNFAGTQELRTQLEQGATADVLASADKRHMDELGLASRIGPAVVFARNEPIIVVALESAGTVQGLADLPNLARIVIGAPEVPIGRYTLQILDRASATLGADFGARVQARVVSRELNVRQVLSKVILGEAQAAIVYRTDAQAARGRVAVVTIPAELNVIAEYPIAVVTGASHFVLARAWVDFVLSPDGQRALNEASFLGPSGSGRPP